MNAFKLRLRYFRIMLFFSQAAINFIVWEVFLQQIGFRRLVRRTRSNRYQRVAFLFRKMAIKMGGVMIKVGQFLSTRLDVLPPEITKELSGLQDEVPPEKFEDIKEIAEKELEGTLEERFDAFDVVPLAAASLGQVHRAKLCVSDSKGEYCDVVVKIQRPFIDQIINVDLAALKKFGGWLQNYKPISKRVNIPSLVEEFSTITLREIDYIAEGKNAETFAENFKEVTHVHVPRVVWSHTTKRVLTLEDVYAIKITDYKEITEAGIDRADVANILLDTYLKQIFEFGFFHADPHPGNLFVTPIQGNENKTEWKLTFVDFGMVGYVPENLRNGLREMLISVGTKDAGRLVRAYQSLGILLPNADTALLEHAEQELFDMFWGKSMAELRNVNHAEMFRFANNFQELLYDLPFQLPQNLLMLGRTLAILSGMCTGLNSEFNLWEQLAPYAKSLISTEGSSNWRIWLDEIGKVLKDLLSLPSQAGRVFDLLERGNLTVQNPSLNRQFRSLEKAVNKLTAGILFLAFFMSSVILYINNQTLFAEILIGLSVITLVWIIFFPGGGPRRFHP
jgi:predicted unusual protein kinase regulating ubiquinone biosynthesis (AarF/ABC1/UbiB family)